MEGSFSDPLSLLKGAAQTKKREKSRKDSENPPAMAARRLMPRGAFSALFLFILPFVFSGAAFQPSAAAAAPLSPASPSKKPRVLLAQDDDIDDSDLLDIDDTSGEDISEEEKDIIEEELDEDDEDLDDEDLDEDEEEEDLDDEDLDEDEEEEDLDDEDLDEDEEEEDEEEEDEDLDDEDLDEEEEEDEGEDEEEEEEDEEEEEEDEGEDEDEEEEDEEDEEEEDREGGLDQEDLDSDGGVPADEEPSEETVSPADELGAGDSVSEEGDSEDLNIITNVRYSPEADQVIIDCSRLCSFQDRENEQNSQYIIEILQSRLGRGLHWPYPMKDFNTNFGWMKADQKDPETVRVLIQVKQDGPFPKAGLSENSRQIIVGFEGGASRPSKMGASDLDDRQILPAKTLEDLYYGNVKFSGSPISFHVIDAPVKQILRFISEESGINMVIDKDVGGTVTLKLEEIPWDQALHIIFKSQSLGYAREGNVITILPLDKIEKRTERLRQIAQKRQALIPFVTRVIPIVYAKLADITKKIDPFLTKPPAGGKGGGQQGKIIPNEEGGAIVVIDTQDAIDRIEKLIRFLDQPPKQVMIEARLVEAFENFNESFNLTWSLNETLPLTISAEGIMQLLANISGSYSFENNAAGDGTGSLSLSGIPFIRNVASSLKIAESEGYARVISSPKVVAISGKSATIERNAPILIGSTTITNTGTGNTTEGVQKEDVKISLKVEPSVTSAGSVFLKVNVERSDPGGEGGAFKIRRSSETEVLVQNGHTVVIGGIYEEDKTFQKQGLPFLSNIPFFGKIFGPQSSNRSKTELLVFLTPKILDAI